MLGTAIQVERPSACGGPPRDHQSPGWVLTHPAALVALVVLVVNDHLLKGLAATHGQLQGVTGKVSDVAGLVFFPLLLVALVDVGLRTAPGAVRSRPLAARSARCRRAVLGVSVAVTGAGFSVIQVLPAAGDAYAAGLQWLRWLPSGVAAWVTGSPAPAATGVNHVMDPTDLWCLPALVVARRIGALRLGMARAGWRPWGLRSRSSGSVSVGDDTVPVSQRGGSALGGATHAAGDHPGAAHPARWWRGSVRG